MPDARGGDKRLMSRDMSYLQRNTVDAICGMTFPSHHRPARHARPPMEINLVHRSEAALKSPRQCGLSGPETSGWLPGNPWRVSIIGYRHARKGVIPVCQLNHPVTVSHMQGFRAAISSAESFCSLLLYRSSASSCASIRPRSPKLTLERWSLVSAKRSDWSLPYSALLIVKLHVPALARLWMRNCDYRKWLEDLTLEEMK